MDTKTPDHISDDFLIENLIKSVSYYLKFGGSYAGLVSKISEHLQALKFMEAKKLNSLQSLWGELETINAVALSEGRQSLSVDEQKDASDLLLLLITSLKTSL